MAEERDDPIIEAGLEELLGGVAPPDLTDRILNSLEHAAGDGSLRRPLVSDDLPNQVAPAIVPADRSRSRVAKQKASSWLMIAAGISIAAIGSTVTWLIIDKGLSPQNGQAPIALPLPQQEPSNDESPSLPPSAIANDSESDRLPQLPDAVDVIPQPESMLVEGGPAEIDDRKTDVVAQVQIPDDRPSALTDEQMVQSINQLIQDQWLALDLEPAPAATDEQWCRRVYVKLIGREPTAAEASSFLESKSPDKRTEVVDLLLTGDTYVEEFASHWSQIWGDILVSTGNGRANQKGLEQFLRRAFGSGKPFDQTALELLTATGSTAIGSEGYNGATNYLVAHSSRDGIHRDATEHVSRTFMGFSVQCAQCHTDSNWSGVEQRQFWELNAFFRQLNVQRERDKWIVSNLPANRRGAQGSDGEVYYDTPDGRLKSAYPVFVDGTAIPHSPVVDEVDRRDMLAKFVTRSEQFRQAMANRFWCELFGVGFTVPPDNIGPHNPPSHPELLSKLGAQFAAHDYDVRSLIRWIVLSKPFALSEDDVITDDQIRAKLVFDRFPKAKPATQPVMQQLRIAGEAYASLLDSANAMATPANIPSVTNPTNLPKTLNEIDNRLASVALQAKRLKDSTVYGTVILESELSDAQKVDHLFYASLHRAPTASEKKAVEDMIEGRGSAVGADTVWQYVWWALASCRESR